MESAPVCQFLKDHGGRLLSADVRRVERSACVRNQGAPNQLLTGNIPIHSQGAGVGKSGFGTRHARRVKL